MSSWLLTSWCRKCFLYSLRKMAMAVSSEAMGTGEDEPFILSIIISVKVSCGTSTSTRSEVCEKGPCPMSCSRMASFAPRHSSSLMSTPFSLRVSRARCMRFRAPSMWLKRVCIAPG